MKKRGFISRLFLWMFWGGLLALMLGAGAAWLAVRSIGSELPEVGQLGKNYAPPQVTRILAKDGTLLGSIFTERRTVIPFEQIPDHVKAAFLAAEDAGFYEHKGLNYWGLLRAIVVNLRAGHVRQGGSTITQQVVKNTLLDSERSYKRKIRETILAYRLEQELSKDQILNLYLNHIYLGHGRYGVEEAARNYFGKHARELDVAEGALLAGIVASPERYSPRRNREYALQRRHYVLGQMQSKGFMPPELYEQAENEALRLAPSSESESDIAPEFVAHAQRTLKKLVGDKAKQGGYTVHTSLEPALEVAARKAVRNGLDEYMKRQKLRPPYALHDRKLWGAPEKGTPRQHRIYTGVVTAVDDAHGSLQVQVGTRQGLLKLLDEERYNPQHLSPSAFAKLGASLRVRVLDDPAKTEGLLHLRLELGPQAALIALSTRDLQVVAAVGSYEALEGGLDRTVQMRRQPGSTFKPLMYSYALNEHKITAATAFHFEPEASAKAKPLPLDLLLRQGIARSDNRVARATMRLAGAARVVDWAHQLGITSELGATEALALGAYEVSPLEMARAYSVFASGGHLGTVSFIERVETSQGDLPLPAEEAGKEVMDPKLAWLTTSLLQSVVKEGTAQRAQSLGRPLAGKTGTTNEAKDAWFVGYSTEYVVAVWVGYDDSLPLGSSESGATAALPIWMEFMKAAHEGKAKLDFPRPPGLLEVEIDGATGLLPRPEASLRKLEYFLPGTEPSELSPEPAASASAEPVAPTQAPPVDGAAPVYDGDLIPDAQAVALPPATVAPPLSLPEDEQETRPY